MTDGRRPVRDAYGERADEYTEVLGSIDAMAPQDRATIADWAAQVDGPIIDAGCGPGHWTNFLHGRGADIAGVEMVPEFVEGARARFPDVTFNDGLIDALPADDCSLAGLLAWYSVIHTPPAEVPAVLREFGRCLDPGGSLLLGFFEGDQVEPFDHAVVTAYFWPVAEMRQVLETAGFAIDRVETRTDPGGRPQAAITATRLPKSGTVTTLVGLVARDVADSGGGMAGDR